MRSRLDAADAGEQLERIVGKSGRKRHARSLIQGLRRYSFMASWAKGLLERGPRVSSSGKPMPRRQRPNNAHPHGLAFSPA